VPVGLTCRPLSLNQDGLLTQWGPQSELIEGNDLSSCLQDPSSSPFRHTKSADSHLGDLVNPPIVRDGPDHDGDLALPPLLPHVSCQGRHRHRGPVDPRHKEPLKNNVVKLGIGPPGQEPVQLDQEAEVHVLALRLRPPDLTVPFVVDVNTHFNGTESAKALRPLQQ